MQLSIKLIKSYIPIEYFDGSKLNGISLIPNSYDLFCLTKGKEYILRTNSTNPLIDLLSKIFDVKYIKHFWWHYSEYTIKIK
jgi:hypothetical protein